MPDPGPDSPSQALHALGRMARGLSALFWGLPLTLLLCLQTARTDWLRAFGIVPPLAASGLLLFGLWEMRFFQPHATRWRRSLEAAQLLALVNCGLTPFLFWWNQAPTQPLFNVAVALLLVSGLVFLSRLNLLLRQLGQLLPDAVLRQETRQFTALNRGLLLVTLALTVLFYVLINVRGPLPQALGYALALLQYHGLWLLIVFVLLPLAMTMALLWKTKEVILNAAFGGGQTEGPA